MQEKRTVAFFDFDKTLIKREGAELGLKWALANGHASLLYALTVVLANQLYKRSLLSADRMASLMMRYYKGRDLRFFIDNVAEFHEKLTRPQYCPETVERVRYHREQGHTLVLLSASVEYLLTNVKSDFGFDYLICSRVGIGNDGLCTGRSEGPMVIGKQKEIAARKLGEQINIDWESSWAYADHHSDLPLLELVGHPVVVRPTPPLRKVATARGWEVIGEKS